MEVSYSHSFSIQLRVKTEFLTLTNPVRNRRCREGALQKRFFAERLTRMICGVKRSRIFGNKFQARPALFTNCDKTACHLMPSNLRKLDGCRAEPSTSNTDVLKLIRVKIGLNLCRQTNYRALFNTYLPTIINVFFKQYVING